MRNSIPNPTKTISVPFSIEEVKKSVKSLKKSLDVIGKRNFEEESYDDLIGELRLTKREFLSMGARVIVNTNYLSDDTTRIDIEVQRVTGAFDNRAEVTYANEHINDVSSALSFALKNNGDIDMDSEDILNAKIVGDKVAAEEKSSNAMGVVIGLIIVVVFFLL